MRYLQYELGLAGVADPHAVALHTAGPEWVDVQVAAEFSALFPDAAVEVNPAGTGRFDLRVLVHDESTPLGELVAWGRRHRGSAGAALAFYCLDPRALAVMPGDRLDAWARRRRIEAAGVRVLQRSTRLRAGLALLSRRCASFS